MATRSAVSRPPASRQRRPRASLPGSGAMFGGPGAVLPPPGVVPSGLCRPAAVWSVGPAGWNPGGWPALWRTTSRRVRALAGGADLTADGGATEQSRANPATARHPHVQIHGHATGTPGCRPQWQPEPSDGKPTRPAGSISNRGPAAAQRHPTEVAGRSRLIPRSQYVVPCHPSLVVCPADISSCLLTGTLPD
jgi:hypothetical protein